MHNYSFLVILLLVLTPVAMQGQSVAQEPVSANDYYFRGLARHNAGQSDSAIADFSKSIELDEAELAATDSGQVKVRLAEAYYQRGKIKLKQQQDVDGAAADFDRAIILNPEYIRAYEQRAVARQLQEDFAGAAADRKQARSLAHAKSKKGNDASHAATAAETDESLAQDAEIPPNAKVYVAERNGFEEHLIAALQKKKVPLVIVADRAEADFELRGGYSGGAGHWTVAGMMIPVPVKVYDDLSGYLSVINLRTGYRVWRETAEVAGGNWWPSPQKMLANKLVGALRKKLAADQKAK